MKIRTLIACICWASVVSAQTAGPVLTKTITPATVGVGGQTTMTFTLTNPNTGSRLTNVQFTDQVPTTAYTRGYLVSASCSPTVWDDTAGTLSVQMRALDPGASCQVGVTLTGVQTGFVNTTSAPTSDQATGVPVTATLAVSVPVALTAAKTFTPPSLAVGQSTMLHILLTNPGAQPVSGVAFTDTLPAGLILVGSVNVTDCGAATINVPPGGSTLTVTAVTVPANSSCDFAFQVTANGTAIGPLVNTTSPITAANSAPVGPVTATVNVTAGEAYQVSYVANLDVADSVVNLTNSGANGAPVNGPGFGAPAGNMCINIYAFSPDEQLVACCSCLITPNGLVSLSANQSLRSNTVTGITPNSMVIKLVSSGAGPAFSGTGCSGSAAAVGTAPYPLAPGMSAWNTVVHTAAGGTPKLTELTFAEATLSPAELESLRSRCSEIISNSSGFGICRGCQFGGLGGVGSSR